MDLKRQGLAKVEHKPPIYEDDLKKIVRKHCLDKSVERWVLNRNFLNCIDFKPE